MAVGDAVIGLASSGIHSNGYSLVRKIVETSGLGFDAPAPFAPVMTLGGALLTPTRLYVKSCLRAIRETGAVKGLAHITGGGFTDNIPRVLPERSRRPHRPHRIDGPSRCSNGWRNRAASPNPNCCGPSIAASAWSPSCGVMRFSRSWMCWRKPAKALRCSVR